MGSNCSCMKNSNEVAEINEDQLEYPQITSYENYLHLDSIPQETLIHLQSILRGFIDRKQAKDLRTGQSHYLATSASVRHLFFIKDSRVPDYSTHTTRQAQLKIGPYRYSMTTEDASLVRRGPVQLENKSIYIGQWTSFCERQGRGTQMLSLIHI